MNPDAANLDRLHDIVVPAAAPWWPPAAGWLWLLAIASLVALVALLRAAIRWQRNRYRREALAELARLQAAASDTGGRDAVALGMAELLKRVALTAYPRRDVAALSGAEWFSFLDRTGRTHFADGLGAALERATYLADSAPSDVAASGEVAGEIRAWIRQHGQC